MQELEKILEEIQDHAIEFEVFGTSDDYISVGWVNDIIRRHMKNEEDILKFYYCESEDDYYIGQRVQNMYYARYADGVFTWFMSRHLPWGKRVTAPETAWKEYTYPTEPKEIPFMEWLKGFVRKHMNAGWIPVEERLPENAKHKGVFCPKYQVDTKYGVTEGWYNPDVKSWYCLFWFMTKRYLEHEIDFAKGDVLKVVRVPLESDIVIAWRPLPEPYRLERSKK